MAIFTQTTVNSLKEDLANVNKGSRVADYLYELNENLSYMFNNLSPEDNYDEKSRLIYVQRGKRIGSLEVRADAIEMRVSDDETNYNTSMQLFSNLLRLSANTPSGSSTMVLTGDKIELTTGKFIVNSTNLKIDAQGNGEFSGTVKAAKIISSDMESSTIKSTSITASTITGNTISGNTISGGTISGTSMSASTISGGTITGTTVNGGTINGTSINGGDSIRFKARAGYIQLGDFEVDDSYGRHIFMSDDEVTGMSSGDVMYSGDLLLWAGWTGDSDDCYFLVNGHGRTQVNGSFYYNGTELENFIRSIVEEYAYEEPEE